MKREEIFRRKLHGISDKELAELVSEENSKMCRSGGNSFTMTVPVSVIDTDMLISELIRRFRILSELNKNN